MKKAMKKKWFTFEQECTQEWLQKRPNKGYNLSQFSDILKIPNIVHIKNSCIISKIKQSYHKSINTSKWVFISGLCLNFLENEVLVVTFTSVHLWEYLQIFAIDKIRKKHCCFL